LSSSSRISYLNQEGVVLLFKLSLVRFAIKTLSLTHSPANKKSAMMMMMMMMMISDLENG